MELRVLTYFIEVANELNITKAANNLHITQPALTRQIQALEDELGKPLLVRHPRSVSLTEHGRFLYRRALEIVELTGDTVQQLSSRSESYTGMIYIATGSTTVNHHIGRVIKNVREMHRDVIFTVYSMDGVDACSYVDRKLLDFAVISGNLDTTKYNRYELPFEDTCGLLIRKDHPLAKKPFITPADMENLPVIWSRQLVSYSDLDGWLGFPNRELNKVVINNLTGNAAIWVEEGLGCSIAYEGYINTSGNSCLCFRRFEPEVRARNSLIWRKDLALSRQAQYFLFSLQHYLEEEQFS